MGLTNHTWPIFHYITPLGPRGWTHSQTDSQTDRQTDRQTDTHTHTQEQKRFQETRCTWPSSVHAWLINSFPVCL